jgi:hypothetical protein
MPPQESSESSPESVRETSELDPLPLLLLRFLSRFFCRLLLLPLPLLDSAQELLVLDSLLLRFRFFCFLFRLLLLRPLLSLEPPSGAPALCSLQKLLYLTLLPVIYELSNVNRTLHTAKIIIFNLFPGYI